MATSNSTQPATRPAAAGAASLLSNLAIKAEHMIALGCVTMLIVLFSCIFGGWWLVDSWTSGGSDTTTTNRAQEWQQPMTMPDCGRGRIYAQTNWRGDIISYSCGR